MRYSPFTTKAGGGLNGIGEPLVRKNRMIVQTTVGTPTSSKIIPSGNLNANGIAILMPMARSTMGASKIMMATAPYQNSAPATDQRTLRRSFFAATR